MRGGFRRFLPVLSVSLRLFLFRAALFAGVWLVLWQLVLSGSFGSAIFALALRFPISVLITLLLSPFWVAVPAAIVEPSWRSLRRSWRLTRGHRRSICRILLLLYGIDWGSGRLLRLAVPFTDLPWLARKGIWWTQDLLVVSLTAVFVAVGYHALRLEKEGVDVSDLERVFA